jgi:hypothetical protein
MSASQTLRLPRAQLSKPLTGTSLAGAALVVWLAGAAYCHGYERLLTGAHEWPNSLIWSAFAVVPWFALFEWSKTERARDWMASPWRLMLILIATAALSLLLELGWNQLIGHYGASLALSMMRRLPAIGASLTLILWAAATYRRRIDDLSAAGVEANGGLVEFGESIDWIEAADNYVEVHLGGRVLMRRMTLREAERQLASVGFVRIHRRFLVNRRKLGGFVGSNGDRRVRIAGAELPVGSRYASRLSD